MENLKSAEDYLERIVMLEEKFGRDGVHAIEVAKSLGFSRASVSVAMHRLEEAGYLEFGPGKELILTKAGRYEGERVFDRHKVLTEVFLLLGVDEKTAAEDACLVEHDLSETTFKAIKDYLASKE